MDDDDDDDRPSTTAPAQSGLMSSPALEVDTHDAVVDALEYGQHARIDGGIDLPVDAEEGQQRERAHARRGSGSKRGARASRPLDADAVVFETHAGRRDDQRPPAPQSRRRWARASARRSSVRPDVQQHDLNPALRIGTALPGHLNDSVTCSGEGFREPRDNSHVRCMANREKILLVTVTNLRAFCLSVSYPWNTHRLSVVP